MNPFQLMAAGCLCVSIFWCYKKWRDDQIMRAAVIGAICYYACRNAKNAEAVLTLLYPVRRCEDSGETGDSRVIDVDEDWRKSIEESNQHTED